MWLVKHPVNMAETRVFFFFYLYYEKKGTLKMTKAEAEL